MDIFCWFLVSALLVAVVLMSLAAFMIAITDLGLEGNVRDWILRKTGKKKKTQIVHCKECVHWVCCDNESPNEGICNGLSGLDHTMMEDDFCCYGKRRNEDD